MINLMNFWSGCMLSEETYNKIKDKFWVRDYYNGETNLHWIWKAGVRKPKWKGCDPDWHRPTFEEAVERQMIYEDDPEFFFSRCKAHSEEEAKYGNT